MAHGRMTAAEMQSAERAAERSMRPYEVRIVAAHEVLDDSAAHVVPVVLDREIDGLTAVAIQAILNRNVGQASYAPLQASREKAEMLAALLRQFGLPASVANDREVWVHGWDPINARATFSILWVPQEKEAT